MHIIIKMHTKENAVLVHNMFRTPKVRNKKIEEGKTWKQEEHQMMPRWVKPTLHHRGGKGFEIWSASLIIDPPLQSSVTEKQICLLATM